MTLSRRSALKTGAAGLTASWISPKPLLAAETESQKRKENLKQSVCRWCYKDMPLDDLARNAAQIGLKSVELLTPEEWPVAKKYGLTCAMGSGADLIHVGFNRKENHDSRIANLTRHIELAVDAGIPNVICFSGNRNGMSDEEGLENCVIGVKRIVGIAEKKGINVCMELLNSKVNHNDYMCDHTEWGVEAGQAGGFAAASSCCTTSITCRSWKAMSFAPSSDNFEYIGHLHTGGNPGRNEIDDTQELNYKAICKAIVDMGFTGYIAHEFIPKRDPMTSLKQAFWICDV